MTAASRQRKPLAPPARRSRGGTLLGIFIGIVFGVLISFGVVWTMNKTPLPFRDKGARVERPANGEEGGPKSLPGKPGDKVGERAGDKPRFEFYKILPGQEAAPTAEKPAAKAADGKGAEGKAAEGRAADAKAAAAEPLYLQVGAFQKPTDADNLKARLALLGLDATVQEVDVPEKGRMYRVRTGPYSSVEEQNRARGQLSQNGIQTAPTRTR